ncbi:MAG: aldehyde dehydrogenase family protein [Pararobbsia sp.]
MRSSVASGATCPCTQRARVLNKFADLFEADLENFYKLETLNNGRPLVETRAQISRLPQFYRYFAALALTRRSDVIPIEGPYLCYTQRVPLGVCALMTSFNHPLMILSKSLAPALATGNSVVIKASEQTPLTTVRLVTLLQQAGVPDGVVNVINGEGREAGAALARHPKIAKIVFTGGTDVGRAIGRGRRAHLRADHPRTRRQGRRDPVRRHGHGSRRERRRVRLLHRRGPDLRVRCAPARAGVDVRSLPRALPREDRRHPRRQPRRPQDPSSAPSFPSVRASASSRCSNAARPTARRCWPAAACPPT